MEFFTTILGIVGGCMQESVKVRFGYLKHYDENIVALKEQLEALKNLEKDVNAVIKAAERDNEKIKNTVQHWVGRVEEVRKEVEAKFSEDNVEVNKRCFGGWFPNLKTRYSLSKEAVNKKETMKGLCEEAAGFDLTNVSQPADAPGIESMTSKDFELFQTTKLAMEKVMAALRDDSTNFVGIHGMGGVGKTTLVKEIGKKCKEEKLFDTVAMAVVSQTFTVEGIQQEIAGFLGFNLGEKGLLLTASELCKRLKREKKVLVILDDVWAKLDLATIGIPSGEDHKGCKVIITTRRRQVCDAMGTGHQSTGIVSLYVLDELESWELFKKQVGDIIESDPLRIEAVKVVKECGGLPIALVTVGKAMRDRDLQEWKEAALELKKSRPTNIEDMDKNVFNCIKFSYDYLRSEEAKACFLLCCLFPEDDNIQIERLVRYVLGLNTFMGIDNIQEARLRTHSTIKNLKGSSLLLEGSREDCIRMHDVVRDVAKTIAKAKYFVQDGGVLKRWPNELSMVEYNGISLLRNEIQKWPDAWECPKLEIFLMHDYNVEQEMPEAVFKGMKKLRVLDQIHNCGGKRNLMPSLSHLTNLQTLIIECGYGIKMSIRGINALGELKMLEVISFRGCEFQEPLRKLNNLRLLELKSCDNCSSLFNYTRTLAEDWNSSQLEELCVSEPMSCSVAELIKCHPRLNVLRFSIDDISRIPENFVFPNFDSFVISVGCSYLVNFPDVTYFENSLYLDGGNGRLDMTLLSRIRTLLPVVNILSILHFQGFRNILPYLLVGSGSLSILTNLVVRECNELEFLINIEEESGTPRPTCFSRLEGVELHKLQSFRGLCGMVPVDVRDSFVSLRNLTIWHCPKMLNIGVPLNLLRRMRQLEVLEIERCRAVEFLFDLKEEVEDAVANEEEGILVNLRTMTLIGMSNLEQLWKGPIGLVHLRNLKNVYIEGCNKLRVLFHWPVAQRLEQLERLTVIQCNQLEEIVGRETGEEGVNKVLFPELQHLKIGKLPKLVGFYTGNLPGSQSTPKLNRIFVVDRIFVAYSIYGEDWHETTVEIADGKNLDTVIKENKGLDHIEEDWNGEHA